MANEIQEKLNKEAEHNFQEGRSLLDSPEWFVERMDKDFEKAIEVFIPEITLIVDPITGQITGRTITASLLQRIRGV